MPKITYTLEMTSPADFRPSEREITGFSVSPVAEPYPELAKFMHTLVGHPWMWGGREGWPEQEWSEYVSQAGFHTSLATLDGAPAGYFELLQQANSIQILCMGLIPRFIGRGLGAPLLTAAVRTAWDLGPDRVWLRTCSHDHPHAKDNYTSRGFRLIATEEDVENAAIPSFWDLVG